MTRLLLLILLLILPSGNIYPLSEILRPDGNGSTNNWVKSTGTYNYQCVDEAVADDADYIRTNGDGVLDLYTLQASALTASANIAYVRIFIRIYDESLQGAVYMAALKLGGTTIYGDPVYSEEYYTSQYHDFATKPGGGAWTYSDLADLEAGVYMADAAYGYCQCSMVYISVDYTISGTPAGVRATNAIVGIRGSSSGGTVRGKQ